MLPVREEDVQDRRYHENLAAVRDRILGFALRKLDFAHAEEIAQSCMIVLWEQYPDKRSLDEMVRISIGIARHKIAQFHRDRARLTGLPETTTYHDDIFERVAAREDTERLLLALLKLPVRCRDLMRLKLIEQKSYPEIRELTGITGNVYETTRRCFQSLLRITGGAA